MYCSAAAMDSTRSDLEIVDMERVVVDRGEPTIIGRLPRHAGAAGRRRDAEPAPNAALRQGDTASKNLSIDSCSSTV